MIEAKRPTAGLMIERLRRHYEKPQPGGLVGGLFLDEVQHPVGLSRVDALTPKETDA